MKHCNRIILGLIFAFAILAQFALATPPNVRVNSNTNNLQNEEQIWVSPIDSRFVISEWRDWRLGYRRIGIGTSTNGGTTWSDSLVSVTFYDRQSDPCLVGDRFGNLFMNMLDYDANSSNTNSLISVWHSTNNGATWTGPVSADEVGDYFEDKQFTAVDRTGGVHDGNYYVSWSRFPNPTQIMFVRSTDGGASFSTAMTVGPSPFIAACGGVQDAGQFSIPIVDADGYVHVFWQGAKYLLGCTSTYAIHHVLSTDGGVSFSSNTPDSIAFTNNLGYYFIDGSVDVYGMPNGDCDISSGPYRNTIYIAQSQFPTGYADRTNVVVRKSTDHGATWSGMNVVNDDDPNALIDQFHPWLSVTDDGVVLLVFYDQRDDPVNHYTFNTYFSASFDGGDTYVHNMRISNTSINPSLALSEREASNEEEPGEEAFERMVESMSRGNVILKNPPRLDPMAGRFAEYIGVHSKRDTISCIWTDTRGGSQDAYSARFLNPLMQPRLYQPTNRDSNFYLSPSLKWSTCWHENDDKYRVEISTDSTFQTITRTYSNLTDNVFTIPVPLDSTAYFWRVKAFRIAEGDSTGYSEFFKFGHLLCYPYTGGDPNNDLTINISDAVFLIQYIFAGGPAPNPLKRGDANCDASTNISDAVYIIAYIFGGGAAPCVGCL